MSAPFRILDPLRPESRFAGRCALTVMAKAPVPGRVKTRLSPPLTAEEAAALNTHFLRDTLASLGLAAGQCPADCVVPYTPAGQEAAFAGALPPATPLLPQRGDGFGERLLTTAADLFACGFSAVCLIDSDSPTVPPGEYVRAVHTLLPAGKEAAHCAVLGLTGAHARLFAGISWSTALVAGETAQRAAEIGLPVMRLRTWFDVDDAHSLARLRRELAGEPGTPVGYAAPHTRAFLGALAGIPEPAGSGEAHGR